MFGGLSSLVLLGFFGLLGLSDVWAIRVFDRVIRVIRDIRVFRTNTWESSLVRSSDAYTAVARFKPSTVANPNEKCQTRGGLHESLSYPILYAISPRLITKVNRCLIFFYAISMQGCQPEGPASNSSFPEK